MTPAAHPDVDAGTHPYIATGLKQNKFGEEKNFAVVAAAMNDLLARPLRCLARCPA